MTLKGSLRKLTIAFLALLIITILYFFPSFKQDSIIQELKYVESNLKSSIFLIDKNNYVARTDIFISKETKIEKAKEIINALIINSKKESHLPSGFKAIIPEWTIINNVNINDNLIKIDFNSKFLNTNEKEKMIEALVYSLTAIDGIEKVLIYIDGEHLNKIDNLVIPNPLDRQFGINKIYDLNNYKDTVKTTVYYLSKYNNNYYYVPITKYSNDNVNKLEIIINELKASPISNTNLISYLKSNAELLDYEILEEKINLSFNTYLLDEFNDNNILEEVKYMIGLSIKDNFNINEINFFVNGELIDSFKSF